jgi:SWI/SNF related-matrix-associated actin-dependent regulator of chromatin subfamily C
MIISIHNPGHEPSVRIRDIESERPQQGSRQRKNEFEPYLNGDITNISQFTAAQIEQPTSVKTQNTESVNSEGIKETNVQKKRFFLTIQLQTFQIY